MSNSNTFENRWRIFFGTANIPEHEPGETAPRKKKRARKRRMTLARAMRQASEAGVAVNGATINADGGVTLSFGVAQGSDVEPNEWDEALR